MKLCPHWKMFFRLTATLLYGCVDKELDDMVGIDDDVDI